MKIILAIVDKLPESASRCPVAKRTWNQEWGMESIYCGYTGRTVLDDTRNFVTRRCAGCPLIKDPEEVQERNEQNESFPPVMGSGDGLGW